MWKTPVVERRNDGVLVYWSEKLSVNDLCVKSQDGSKGSEHKRLDVRNDSSPLIQKKYSRPRRIPSDGRDTVSIVSSAVLVANLPLSHSVAQMIQQDITAKSYSIPIPSAADSKSSGGVSLGYAG